MLPNENVPVCWETDRKYFYCGEIIAETQKGNIYEDPKVIVHEEHRGREIAPIDLVKLIQISNFTHVQLPFSKTELNTLGAGNSKQSAVRGRNSVLKSQLPVQKKADHFSYDWKALNHPWPGDVLSNPDSAAV